MISIASIRSAYQAFDACLEAAIIFRAQRRAARSLRKDKKPVKTTVIIRCDNITYCVVLADELTAEDIYGIVRHKRQLENLDRILKEEQNG